MSRPGAGELKRRQEQARAKAREERQQTGEPISEPAAATNSTAEAISFKAVRDALQRIPAMMALVFVTFLGVGLIAPEVKLFAMERYRLDEVAFGKLFPIPALIVAALAIPLGRVGDIWGKQRAIQVGMTICAVSLWLVLFLKAEWSIVVLGSILGIGFVLAFPAYMALLSELTGPEERGGIIGAVRMGQGFGLMVGAMLSSLLYEKVGHIVPFVGAAGMLTIAATLSYLYVRNNMKISPTSPIPAGVATNL